MDKRCTSICNSIAAVDDTYGRSNFNNNVR